MSILSKRITAGELGSAAHADLVAWFFLQILASHVLLPVLAISYLRSRSVTSRAAVVNLCCTWMISGIVSTLLLYAGTPVDAEPGKGVCIAQTALLGGVAPMTAVALLMLVYDRSSAHPVKTPEGSVRRQSAKRVAMMAAPYCIFIVYTACGVQLATYHPIDVGRAQSFFYCSMGGMGFTTAVRFFTAIVSIVAAILQGLSLSSLRQRQQDMGVDSDNLRPAVGFSTRVMIFALYSLISAIASLAAIEMPESAFPDMFAASVGIALFLIIGSDSRILRTWGCRRPRRPKTAEPASHQPIRLSISPTSASFDLDLLKTRTDSQASEQARLEALQRYYADRVRGLGVDVKIIAKPEDAFVSRRDSGVVMHDDEESGLPEAPSPMWRF